VISLNLTRVRGRSIANFTVTRSGGYRLPQSLLEMCCDVHVIVIHKWYIFPYKSRHLLGPGRAPCTSCVYARESLQYSSSSSKEFSTQVSPSFAIAMRVPLLLTKQP